MSLYEIDGGADRRYFVVANSYAEAEGLWKKKYNSIPIKIEYVTSYVLVSKELLK